MPSSAASPRDHRRRPQARPGRGRTSVREAVDAGRRSAERRAPESELVPVCHELRSSRARWHTGAGLGRSARRRTRRPCACRHPRQLLERRQPVVATLAASALDDDLTPAPKQRPPRRGSPSCTRASRRSAHGTAARATDSRIGIARTYRYSTAIRTIPISAIRRVRLYSLRENALRSCALRRYALRPHALRPAPGKG